MTRTIAVLITCFNRREKTLACLRRLAQQQLPPDHRLQVYLVDDGSTDGTAEAVRAEFPESRILQGTGSLYWAGGMRFAWVEAAKNLPDYFLLLNDDTEIVHQAIAILLDIVGSPDDRVIAVAAISDPATGKVIYGAYHTAIRERRSPEGVKQNCNTFNANCVLVPAAVHREIGMLDEAYTHGMADPDYGYRAYHAGINVIESGEILGTCAPNPKSGTWQDPSLSRKRRWQLVMRPTGLPYKDWFIYCKRHLGAKWLFYFISPYLRILFRR